MSLKQFNDFAYLVQIFQTYFCLFPMTSLRPQLHPEFKSASFKFSVKTGSSCLSWYDLTACKIWHGTELWEFTLMEVSSEKGSGWKKHAWIYMHTKTEFLFGWIHNPFMFIYVDDQMQEIYSWKSELSIQSPEGNSEQHFQWQGLPVLVNYTSHLIRQGK